ncbi:MAG: uroporphyrinogen decarboxylase family protein [Victivallales bacterium]
MSQTKKNIPPAADLVARNKAKYETLYRKKKGAVVTIDFPAEGYENFNQVRRLDDAEFDYSQTLALYAKDCDAVAAGFDNVPVTSFSIGGVAYLIAMAYGCELVRNESNVVSAAHAYASIAEASEMKPLERIWERGLYPLIFERIAEFSRRHGDLAVTISDNQSPIDVFTSIVNPEEAMLGMYDDPETTHRILGIIANSIVEINRHFAGTLTDFAGFHAGRYLPFGMHVSDDNAAFLSPAIYDEFARPYAERLSDEFGGIAFHCCMKYEQNLAAISATKGFMGFDPQTAFNDASKIMSAVEGRGVWHIRINPWEKPQDASPDLEERVRLIFEMLEGRDIGVEFWCFGQTRDEAVRLGNMVKERASRQGMLIE